MTRTASKFKGSAGFTLLELLIVVAVIAILVVFLAPVIANNICKAKRSEVQAAIDVCQAVISQSDVKGVIDCLEKADKLLKKLDPDCLEKGRTLIQEAADRINKKIDDLKGQTEISDADKEKLEKAKIQLPPKK